MRHWSRSILGSGLFLGCVVLFNVKLIALLNVGTCASGNQPFEISRPCPVGATFLVMGVPALVFLATRAGTGSRTRKMRRFAPAGQPVSAPEPRCVPSAPGRPGAGGGALRRRHDQQARAIAAPP